MRSWPRSRISRILEEPLRRDMRELEPRLKHDLTVRLGSMMVIAVGAVAALVKLR